MIVVTTPTGHIGKGVLSELLNSGESVRLFLRDPAKIPNDVLARCEIVRGSLEDSASVRKAYAGAESVFFVIPPSQTYTDVDEYYRNFGRISCDAINAEKVKRVVYISGTGLGVNKRAGGVSASFLVEQMIDSLQAATRILHCGTFMENLLHAVPALKFQNQFAATVEKDIPLPWVATRDIAEKAAQLLRDKTWSGRSSVSVLGPEDLSYGQLAEIMSQELGRTIQYTQMNVEDYKAMVMKFGSSEAAAEGLIEIYASMNDKTFNMVKRTHANSSPTSFRDWFKTDLKPLITA
jgi:uncharacterized protein YbjT (DUF2867 family)